MIHNVPGCSIRLFNVSKVEKVLESYRKIKNYPEAS